MFWRELDIYGRKRKGRNREKMSLPEGNQNREINEGKADRQRILRVNLK